MDSKDTQGLDKLAREHQDAQRYGASSSTTTTSNAEQGSDAPPPTYDATPARGHLGGGNLAPTVSEPFNFPSAEPLPSYSAAAATASSSSSSSRRIAIPQIHPDLVSPFLSAYPPALLQYGITSESWHAFVTTMSAFLSAKVSQRAISHAGDVGRQIAQHPKSVGKSLYSHSKTIGSNIVNNAKRGNIVGAAFGVVGGLVSLPLHAAGGLVASTVALPAHAVGAFAKTPQTPLERALAYAVVANQDWLNARGLQADVVDMKMLAEDDCGTDVPTMMNAVRPLQQGAQRATDMLRALDRYVAPLEVTDDQNLELGEKTLWLVLRPVDVPEGVEAAASEQKRKGSSQKN